MDDRPAAPLRSSSVASRSEGHADRVYGPHGEVDGVVDEVDRGMDSEEHGQNMVDMSSMMDMPQEAGGDDLDESRPLEVGFASSQIMAVVKPIIICMIMTIFLVRTIHMGVDNSQQRWAGLAYDEDSDSEASGAQKLGGALINALIFVVLITVMTFVFVLLYKYGCMKIIYGWLMMSSSMMLGAIGAYIFLRLLTVYNAPLDLFSFLFILFNFACVGMAAIFWQAPLRLQQSYLIISSSFLATMFYALLPTWTRWVLLAAVAVYDIVAVLCPKGPLRMLVETAQERPNQALPGLLYHTGMAFTTVTMADADRSGPSSSDGVPARPPRTSASSSAARPVTVINEDGTRIRAKYRYEYEYEYDESDDDEARDGGRRGRRSRGPPALAPSASDEESSSGGVPPPLPTRLTVERETLDGAEDQLLGNRARADGAIPAPASGAYSSPLERESGRGLSLGLGDAVFYSVLSSSSSASGGLMAFFTTSAAILVGLELTLFCLGVFKKALPALPFSIALGIFTYLATELVMSPYFIQLSMAGVVV
ncbi:presenilin-B [Thecamonas trahens ATCC 50062]|uniref:Presenilin n=1 Tax=Thecamonas trahens ATCC 50062 TaxID=461836 RepID=A0A0L0DQ69_THETB|nr:presenilin-B [Thecamonas trahens ATCC 50062]KNC54415.1 presenilin-B [Thecamonas trahens ATCC 50062]|eukprot:XP_013753711.1 presenilin-B [Thecamonas trahens ATCC 50062]